MKSRPGRDALIFFLGIAGFLGLLLAGSYYPPGAVWLRVTALVWFISFGLLRCFTMLAAMETDTLQEGERPWSRSAPVSPMRATKAAAGRRRDPDRPWS